MTGLHVFFSILHKTILFVVCNPLLLEATFSPETNQKTLWPEAPQASIEVFENGVALSGYPFALGDSTFRLRQKQSEMPEFKPLDT